MRFSQPKHRLYFSQPDAGVAGELVIAGLDICDSHVRAALISIGLGRLEILSQADVALGQGSATGDLSSGLAAYQSACRQALRLVSQQHTGADPASIVIGLSGELIKGMTQMTRVERPNPRLPLAEAELDRLLLDNQAAALQAANAEIEREQRAAEIDLQLLNSSLISVRADGRRVLNPLDYQAMTVAFEVYSVFIPHKWLQAGQKIAEHLNLNLIAMAYKPFALARGLLAGSRQKLDEALIINVGEQSTDLAIISGGVLSYSRHFPLGLRNFERSLGRYLMFDRSDLLALQTPAGDYNLASLESEQQSRATRALAQTSLVWLQGLSLTLKDLKLERLPGKIYLSGSGGSLGCIRESLAKPNWAQLVSLDGPAEILPLDLQAMPAVESALGVESRLLATLAGLGCLASDILNVVQNMPRPEHSDADLPAAG